MIDTQPMDSLNLNSTGHMADSSFDFMPSYSVQRSNSQVTGFFENDGFLTKSPSVYDSHADSFLYSSSNGPSTNQSSLLNAPPLPPRNYIQNDFGSQRTPPPLPARSLFPSDQRPCFNSIDTGYMNPLPSSAHSSASLSSPNHGFSYWNRSFADLPVDSYQRDTVSSVSGKPRHISSQLTATAPPFVATSQNSFKFGKEEDKRVESMEPKLEKKKGNGEDVDINKLLSGEETRSAVMIRNIPNRFSKEELCEILDPLVKGKYTILNMPLDSKTHRNLGYSFIQFHSIEDLIVAYQGVGIESLFLIISYKGKSGLNLNQ